MALIVENGTGLPNSDAYISLVDARAYAAAYGYTLPADDTLAEVSIRQGTQYIEMQESCFSGTRLTETQSLAWPRVNAVNAYGFKIAGDSIPVQLGYASVAAAAEFGLGTDVRATDDGRAIASEEITGAVAVSYFNNGKTGGTVTITKALDALKSLLVSCANNGFEFRVGRG